MLIERVTNAWMRYRLLAENPLGAFLYIASRCSAYGWQKARVLADIVNTHPEVSSSLSDAILFKAFSSLDDWLKSRGEVLLPQELEWVKKYIKDPELHYRIEKVIFRRLLEALECWDELRREFAWSIPLAEQKQIVGEVLSWLSNRRKRQLAKEFDLLADPAWLQSDFRRLLRNHQYDEAAALKLPDVDEAVIAAIVEHLDAGHLGDADCLAELFLPHRPEIAIELKQIAAVINQ